MIERVGWYSIGINVFLTALNLAVSLASGSLAVAAEMVHNLVDLIASVAVLAGLKLSQRKSGSFPYGLYKVENVVAVGIALLIFLAGYEIARQAVFGVQTETQIDGWIVGGVILSMTVPYAFSLYEMRVARASNSPSLIADAQEYRVHVFSSGLVLVALIGNQLGLALDRLAALAVVVLIAKTGWELLSDGMRVLLDASLDPETLALARQVVEQQPAVIEIKSLTGRNAGRYRFLETEVLLRITDLDKAHQVSQAIERAIRQEVPHVERVLIHYEPAQKAVQRVAFPLDGPAGPMSAHFGSAAHFRLMDVRVSDGTTQGQVVALNPHAAAEKQRGLGVARWLLEQGIDVIISQDDLSQKAPGYLLQDAGVQLASTAAADADQALTAWLRD